MYRAAFVSWFLACQLVAQPPSQPAPVTPPPDSTEIIFPTVTPVTPPAPPPQPIGATTKLPAGVYYVLQSEAPFLTVSSPDGYLSIIRETGPIKLLGTFIDAPTKVQSRSFTKKYVTVITAGAVSGQCEALVWTVGATDEKQIVRRTLDVGQLPIPPPGPPEPPGPQPPAPSGTGVYAVVVVDKAQPSMNTALVVDGPTLRALKAKQQCRVYDVTDHAAELARLGYSKLMARDQLTAPCILIVDASGHKVAGEKVTDETRMAELVKGAMKP
jgi:hypothetical protein